MACYFQLSPIEQTLFAQALASTFMPQVCSEEVKLSEFTAPIFLKPRLLPWS